MNKYLLLNSTICKGRLCGEVEEEQSEDTGVNGKDMLRTCTEYQKECNKYIMYIKHALIIKILNEK